MSDQNENIQRAFSDPEVQAKIRRAKAIIDAQKTSEGEVRKAATEEIEVVMAPQAGEAEQAADAQPQKGQATKIDWSRFDLNPSLAHFYPSAEVIPTADGARIVVMLDEFDFITNAWSKLGADVSNAANGPDRWNIATVIGNGSGLGVVMVHRRTPMDLPTPLPLKSTADMPEIPQDAELQGVEDTAIDWIKAEGISVNDVEDEIVPLATLAGQQALEARDAAE